MKSPPRQAGAKRPTPDELKGFERALDKAYARLRERARAEWLRHHAGKPDPADARISVHITAEIESLPPAEPKPKPVSQRLVSKPRKARRKLPRVKARRPKYREASA